MGELEREGFHSTSTASILHLAPTVRAVLVQTRHLQPAGNAHGPKHMCAGEHGGDFDGPIRPWSQMGLAADLACLERVVLDSILCIAHGLSEDGLRACRAEIARRGMARFLVGIYTGDVQKATEEYWKCESIHGWHSVL
jgi:hypothetical protein